jgi:hypothetical protein
MFGSKTKDPVETFRRAINAAISGATHGISTAEVVSFLRTRAQQIEDQRYCPVPASRMHDADGKLIDWNAKVEAARRERQRIADEKSVIFPHLRQHAASGYKAP